MEVKKKKIRHIGAFIVVFALVFFAVFTDSMISSAAKGQTFVVTNNEDSDPGSLRQAILDANANPGFDKIVFDIQSEPNVGEVYVIYVESLLPPITDPVYIDGTSQPGYSKHNDPLVEISGSQFSKSCYGVEGGRYRDHPGLDIVNNSSGDASGTTIEGLKVSNFCQAISISANLEGPQLSCLNAAVSTLSIANITLKNNFIEGNWDGNGAVDLCFAKNSKILDNYFYDNGDHMEVTRSQGVLIEGNVGEIAQDALELVRSHQITVKNNNFFNGRRGGIVLVFESYDNLIIGNEITNVAGMGLTLSNNNIATGNKIIGSGWFGIEVRGGSNNTISHNVVKNNGLGGIAVNAGTLNGLDNCPTFDENGYPDPTEDCAVKFTVVNPNIQGDAFNNLIMDNEVAFNNGPGIVVGGRFFDLSGTERQAAFNTLSGNLIYGNEGLGIDLTDDTQNAFFIVEEPLLGVFGQVVLAYGDGFTPNDSTLVANHGQNYPVLTSARVNSGRLVIKGIIDSLNPETVKIEIFANPTPVPGGDPTGYGEGAIYLGSVLPDAQGGFTVTFPSLPVGTMITATATDAEGNTSEFAENIDVKWFKP